MTLQSRFQYHFSKLTFQFIHGSVGFVVAFISKLDLNWWSISSSRVTQQTECCFEQVRVLASFFMSISPIAYMNHSKVRLIRSFTFLAQDY